MRDLYLPIWYGEKVFTRVDIKGPTAGLIADVVKLNQDGRIAQGLYRFVYGCIDALYTADGTAETNPDKIRDITRYMKQKCVEDIALDIMLIYDPQDLVEGLYNCPRCYHRIVCENRDGFDTRDRISDLPVIPFEGDADRFSISLSQPLILKDKAGNVLYNITTMEFRHATIDDLIAASSMFTQDYTRRQYKIYMDCLIGINGGSIDTVIKQHFGIKMFDSIANIRDLNLVSREMRKYGRQTRVTKECPECGKQFEVEINTANFFASGLHAL